MSKNLNNLRDKIDSIDEEIIQLLAKRMDAAIKIKTIKLKAGMATFDPSREEKLKTRIKKLAAQNRLSEGFCLRLYELILVESKRVQDSMGN